MGPGEETRSIALNDAERTYLERLAGRRAKPTRRQKAQALLALAAGKTVDDVARRIGAPREDVVALASGFAQGRLAGVGLGQTAAVGHGAKTGRERKAGRLGAIEKSPGVCGGAARVAGTRIPVWQLIEARNLGASEAQLLLDFPRLRAADLVAAWAYAEAHPEEIAAEIRRNEVA